MVLDVDVGAVGVPGLKLIDKTQKNMMKVKDFSYLDLSFLSLCRSSLAHVLRNSLMSVSTDTMLRAGFQ